MTGVEIALAVASAAASAYGVYANNQAVAAANKANAQAADYNAQVAAQNAEIARRNAGAREDQVRQQARQVLARQRAAAAQSGFDSTSGSLGLVQEQSSDLAELDALNVRYAGDLEARGYGNQSTLDRYSGDVLRAQASNASRAGTVGAAASLLTSAAGGYGSYQRSLAINRPTVVTGGGGT